MLKNLINYIKDREYLIGIFDKKIYIYNYLEVIESSNSKILIKLSNKKISIKGSDLFINKLENSEILIIGNIKGLDFYE